MQLSNGAEICFMKKRKRGAIRMKKSVIVATTIVVASVVVGAVVWIIKRKT